MRAEKEKAPPRKPFDRKGGHQWSLLIYSGEYMVSFLKVLNRGKEALHFLWPFPSLTSFHVPLYQAIESEALAGGREVQSGQR